jgi:hypothetical protein
MSCSPSVQVSQVSQDMSQDTKSGVLDRCPEQGYGPPDRTRQDTWHPGPASPQSEVFVRPDPDRLRAFGWASGKSWVRCRSCQAMHHANKLAMCCKPCAEAASLAVRS